MLRSPPPLVTGLLLAGGGCYLPPAQVATLRGIRVHLTAGGSSNLDGTRPVRHEGSRVYLESDSLLMWSDSGDRLFAIPVDT